MVNFWRLVDEVIEDSDIVLMVVDARHIEQTNNTELVRKVAAAKKTLITVINKADLVDKSLLEKYKRKLYPCTFVSAQKFYGITMLRHMILRFAEVTPVVVGVVGYPNTGKSSVINALKGKASAGVSSVSGYTVGKQNIRIDNKIRVIDTPGVIAGGDDTASIKLKISASMNVKKDHDLAVYELFKAYAKPIAKFYKLDEEETNSMDEVELLEAIAIKLNRVIKGGEPDIMTTAKRILNDWQKGRIVV